MRSAAAKGNRFKVLADAGGAGVVPSGMMTRQRAKKTYLEAASAQLAKRLSLKRATDHSAPKVSVGNKASVTTSPERPTKRRKMSVAESAAAVTTKQAKPGDGAIMVSTPEIVSPAQSPISNKTNVKEVIDQVKESGKEFSKIADQYRFKDDHLSYMSWTVRFKTELENYELQDTLTDEMSATLLASHMHSEPEFHGDDKLLIACQKQKTVYHMLAKCIPMEATSVVITALKEHTAFHAWRALRTYYI